MFRRALKAALVLASSVIAIPYAVALIANVICGWPMRPDRYRRALNPRKVFALNYALLLQLTKVRYAGLALKWQRFYQSAGSRTIIKNIPFGSNDNFLDVHISGMDLGGRVSEMKKKPVMIFIYGGTWSSGDKNMYGMLCSHLAKELGVLVICPNYSTYPTGFVDDMVQDVADTLQWVRQHSESFGGNRDEVILVGHSAGGHLAALTVLELCLKRLVVDENSMLLSADEVAEATVKGESLELSFVGLTSATGSASFHFQEQHFNGGRSDSRGGDEKGAGGRDPAGAATARPGDHGDGLLESSSVLESYCFIEKETEDKEKAEEDENAASEEGSGTATAPEVGHSAESMKEVMEMGKEAASDGVLPGEDESLAPTAESRDDDLLSCIKLVVGLAGVYNIAEHFEFESERGIEDISTMGRAMYDQKHFEQFSPTLLAKALPQHIRLPPFHLLHGDADYIVPIGSSVGFGEALWERGVRSVEVVILPGCNHYDICFDLMDRGRLWHDVILNEIRRSLSRSLAGF